MSRGKRLGWPVLALVLAAVALPVPVQAADQPPMRLTGLNRRGGRLLVSVGVQDVVQPADLPRLTSGFATRVLVRVMLVRLDIRELVAQSFRHTEIVYDLWDETFKVRRTDTSADPAGRVLFEAQEQRMVEKAADALALATELRHFPIAELSRLEPGGTYQLRVRADLNPLSPDVVAEVRRWLVRPPAQGRLGPADSFFGSFVSIFVNPQIEESERRIEFVSQPFVGPAR
jgi:hypothetical protein